MAEIKQELGFNAASAIKTLAQLDSALKAYNQGLNKTVGGMKSFNQQAGKTVAALKNLASHSKVAVEQLTKLSGIQSRAGIAPTVGKISTPDISKYMDVLQKLSPLTEKSTTAQKRAWQSLATKTAEVAARNRMSVKEMMSINSKLGQSLTGPANTIANNMQKMSKTAQDTAKKWTVSWETIGRVVATQMIVRTLSMIREALKDAVSGAIDFQKAVAEIGTIAGGLGGLEKIKDMVLRVSNAFNVDLADATEAAYQTVSNQIAQTEADVESFLGTAAKFAKITKTDMTTAVNLLSGTLNAFGKDVSEAEEVAAKFFNTIKLGRTRAEELAQSMGSINPIAVKLGITMEELNAAVATLTIQGLKTDKVVTQIRGSMQAFLKPTGEMEAAMLSLGFETSEQIFEAYNFQEALVAVIGETDGSAKAVSKLVPRVRGLTGTIGLASDEIGHFNKSMKEQKEALGEVYDKAYHLIITTDAEKVTKALTQLKNVMVDVFGQKFLSGAAWIIKTIQGIATDEIDIITKKYDERGKKHADLLTKELNNEKDSLEERAKLLAQYAATARIEFFAGARAAEEANQIIAASTQWAIDSMMGPVDAAISAITKASAEVGKVLKEIDAFSSRTLSQTQDKLFARGLSRIEDPFEKVSILRRKAAEEALKAQEMASKADIKGAAQAHQLSQAYNDQAFAIAKNLVLTEKQIRKIRESDKATQDQLKSIRDSRKANKLLDQVNQDYIYHQKFLNEANEKGKIVTKEGAKGLAEAGREIIKYRAKLDTLIKKMKEAQKAASDKDLTPEDQIKLAEKLQVATNNYLDTFAVGVKKFAQSADPLVKKLFQAIEAQDMTVEIETIMTLPSNIQEILGMIRDLVTDFFQKIPLAIQLFAEERGLAMDTPKRIDEAVKQYSQNLIEQAEKSDAAKQAALSLKNELKKVDEIIKSLTKRVTVGEVAKGLIGSLLTKNLVANAREALAKPGQFDDFAEIIGIINEGLRTGFSDKQILLVRKGLESLAHNGFKSVEVMRQLSDAITEIAQLQKATAGPEIGVSQPKLSVEYAMRAGQMSVEQIQKETIARQGTGVAIDANKSKTDAAVASQKALTLAVQESSRAVTEQPMKVQQTDQAATQLQGTQAAITTEVGNTNSGMQQMTFQIRAADGAAKSLVATLSAAVSTSAQIIKNPYYVKKSQGGQVGYFANGGQGTDIINAKLSAGEHVTNAKSSRRFFSQLQAINAGQTPVYRNSGGDTYNTNVGDINITESSRPQQTGREVMNIIRRERRRGSSRI